MGLDIVAKESWTKIVACFMYVELAWKVTRTGSDRSGYFQHTYVSRWIGMGGAAGAEQHNTTGSKRTHIHVSSHMNSHIISSFKLMASSIFEYGVSRPYPFRWFTPVAFIGGTVALVLFSLLNFLSTGYTQRYIQPYIVDSLLCIGS